MATTFLSLRREIGAPKWLAQLVGLTILLIVLIGLLVIAKPHIQKLDDSTSDEIPALLRGFVFDVEFRKTEHPCRPLPLRSKFFLGANADVAGTGILQENRVQCWRKISVSTLLGQARKRSEQKAPTLGAFAMR